MSETIAIGDNVALASGRHGTVKAFELYAGGLYVLDVEGETVVAQRHQFQPVKWGAAKVCSTGIGVCAKGADGPMNMWVQANTYSSAAEMERAYAARRARLMPQAKPVVHRPQEAVDENSDAAANSTAAKDKSLPPARYIEMRCEELGVSHREVTGHSRRRDVVEVRYRLIVEVHNRFTHLSMYRIGQHFGTDHTSVKRAMERHGYKAEKRPRVTQDLIDEMHRLHAEDVPIMDIARRVGVNDYTVRCYVIEGYRDHVIQKRRENAAMLRERKAKAA